MSYNRALFELMQDQLAGKLRGLADRVEAGELVPILLAYRTEHETHKNEYVLNACPSDAVLMAHDLESHARQARAEESKTADHVVVSGPPREMNVEERIAALHKELVALTPAVVERNSRAHAEPAEPAAE